MACEVKYRGSTYSSYNDLIDFLKKSTSINLNRESVVPSDYYTNNISGGSMNKEQATFFVKRMLPNLSETEISKRIQYISKIDMLRKTEGIDAWGYFQDGSLYLLENPTDNTVKTKVIRHEIFHMIFSNFLSQDEKDKVLSAAKRLKGGLAVSSNEQLEEFLADKFMDFNTKSKFEAILTNLFNKIKEIFGFVVSSKNQINQLFDAIDRGNLDNDFNSEVTSSRFMKINKEFHGNPAYYRGVYNEVLDRLDNLMNPNESIGVEFINKRSENGEVKYDKVLNLPFTRSEAIRNLKQQYISRFNELSQKSELTEDEASELFNNALLIDNPANKDRTRVFDNLIKDIYPNLNWLNNGVEIEQSIISDNSLVDMFEAIDDFNEEQTAETDTTKITGKKNETSESEEINPLSRASEAVKDLISTITYRDGSGELKRVEPGYVFYKLINAFSMMKFHTSDKLSSKDEIIKKITSRITPTNKKVSFKDKAILTKITSIVEKAYSTTFENEGRNQNLNPDRYFHWVGTNENTGYYEFHLKSPSGANVMISLQKFKNNTPKTFVYLHEGLNNKNINISYDEIRALYEKAEAINKLAEMYTVTGSLRLKDVQQGQQKNTRTGEGSSNISSANIKRVYSGFEQKSYSDEFQTLLKNQILLNMNGERIRLLNSEISSIPTTNKTEDFSRKVNFIKKVFEQLNLNNKIDVYSDAQANNIILGLKSLLGDFSKLKEDEITDERIQDILDDSNNRIKPLIELILDSNEGLQRSTSFSTADGKTKWYYTLANHAFSMFTDLTDPHITKIEAAEFLKNETSIMKMNYFNKFSDNKHYVTNDITRIVDHESILDSIISDTSKPTTYTKESLKDHMLRNIFYQYLTYMGQSTDKKELRYFQSFYTISDKSIMSSAEVRVFDNKDIKLGIKQLIHNEAYVNLQGAKSDLSKKQFRDNTNLSNIQGLIDFINKEIPGIPIGEAIQTLSSNTKLMNSAISYIEQVFKDEASKIVDKIFSNKIRFDENSARGIARLYSSMGIKSDFISQIPTSRKMYEAMTSEQISQMKSDLLPAMQNFFANHYLNSSMLNQIALGDLKQYKNDIDAIKRMAGPFAVGQLGFIRDEKDKYFNLAVLEDEGAIKFLHGDAIEKNLPKDVLDIVNKRFSGETDKDNVNDEYDTTDAQGYAIPERLAFIRNAYGRSSNFGTAIKPVYHGKNDVGVATYIKNSVVEITNELAKAFPKLKNMRYQMTFGNLIKTLNQEGQDELLSLYDQLVDNNFTNTESIVNNKLFSKYNDYIIKAEEAGFIHEVAFKTAVKTGAPSTMTNTKDDNFSIDPASVIRLNNADYRIQLNLRKTKVETKISHPTQLTYFPNSNNLNKDEQYHILDRLSERISFGMEEIFDNYGIIANNDGTVTIPNSETRKKIAKEVTNMVEGVPGNERVADFLNEPGISLNFPVITDKVSQLLLSHFNKETVAIKHPGKKLILQSVFGTKAKTTGDLIFSSQKFNQNHSEPELVVQKINGELRYYAECYIPHYISDQYSIKDGDQIAINSPAYNQLMGYRIPSTELHSSVPLKVIGYYPSKENDNVIIVPKEIVLLHGSDFDIDTLYVMTPAIASKTIINPNPNTNETIAIEGVPIGKIVDYSTNEDGLVTLSGDIKNKEGFLENIRQEIKDLRGTENKEMQSYLKDLKDLYKKGISNDILYTFTDMISAMRNFTSMTKPISQEPFDNSNKTAPESKLAEVKARIGLLSLKNDLTTSQKQEKKLYEDYLSGWENNKVDTKLRESINKSKKYLSNYNDQSLIHKDNFLAKDLTGISANFVKAVRYIFIGANEQNPTLKEDLQVMINGKTFDQLQREQRNSNGEIIPGAFNTDVLDTIINAAIDHVKEQKLNLFNINNDNAPAFMAAIAMGVNITDATFMQLHPSILEFTVGINKRDLNSPQKVKSFIGQFLASKKDESEAQKYLDGLLNTTELKSIDIQKYDGNTTLENLINTNDIAALEYQYGFIDQYAKIYETGKQIDNFAKTISIIQNLGQNYVNLRGVVESYEDIFDVDSFLKTGESKDNPDFAFSNVKIQNIPNVTQALKTGGYFLNLMEKIFQKYHKNSWAFAEQVEGIIKNKAKLAKEFEEKSDENIEQEERELENVSNVDDIDPINTIKTPGTGFLDRNTLKSFKATIESFFHYMGTGMSYADPFTQKIYSISVLDETPYELQNGTIISGFSAWYERFLKEGFPSEFTTNNGDSLRSRPLYSILADNAKLSQPNKFLLALAPKFNSFTKVNSLVFMKGAISDLLEKLELQEDFKKIMFMDIIYQDSKGNKVPYININMDTISSQGYNDLQHHLLKYSVLKDGLKFGSQSYSSIMTPSIFTSFADRTESILWDTIRNKDNKATYTFDKIQLHFALQHAINNIDKIQSIGNILNKNSIQPVKESLLEMQFSKLQYKNGIYFNIKQSIEKPEDYNKYPTFARLNNTLYTKIKTTDNSSVYYQKVAYNDGRSSYQFYPSINTKGYLIDNHFGSNILTVPIKEFNQIGEENVTINLKKSYDQNNFMIIGTEVYLYNANDLTRAGMKKYTVVNKTINSIETKSGENIIKVAKDITYNFKLNDIADRSNLKTEIDSSNLTEDNTRFIQALDTKYNNIDIYSDYSSSMSDQEKIDYDSSKRGFENKKCK